jgi:glycosidase
MATARLTDLDWAAALSRPHHPSPSSWADQVLYFFLVDRFSDGREDGVLDAGGHRADGETPLFTPADAGNAVGTAAEAAAWREAGVRWNGGTLGGARAKLGYLRRMGITALWVSPVLRQRPGTQDYHGYGIQNFLDVDPHFGTADDLRSLVAEAHQLGMYVILDVVLNHTADVFDYDADRYDTVDPDTGEHVMDPRWDARPYAVAGWRDETGAAVLDFASPVGDRPDAGVWPAELQQPASYTARGRITNWDNDPEFREGDFETYKDVHHGTGPLEGYQTSRALQTLARAYSYWIADADLDGFRIDTVKHMDPGATRYLSSAIKEFAQSIGKDRFFCVGEITGSRAFAFDLMQTTGLDAALGLADVQGQLENTAKGWTDPTGYFDLFRNSELVGQGSHTWFGPHVVTSYDDHDQVRKGTAKARFAADADGAALALAALVLNVTTLGIPCVYYGSEQLFDGRGDHDRYLREAMFGGGFGPFRSRGRHCFDESSATFGSLSAVLAVRRSELALRRGRQYLRPISDDGVAFWLPTRIGEGRLTSLIAWSRILSDRELVVVINTDLAATRSAMITIDDALHAAGDRYRYRYSSDPGTIGSETDVQPANGKAIQVTVPPGGAAILEPV